MSLEEYIGKTYNNWTVVGVTGNKHNTKRMCLVQCACGTTKETASVSDIVSGKSKSCGCLFPSHAKNVVTEIFPGVRFGRLEVIEKDPKNTYGQSWWKCMCDCGNEVIVSRTSLMYYNKSCGCMHRENTISRAAEKRQSRYLGKFYGYLEVIDFVKSENLKYDAVCLCHGCGTTVVKPTGFLLSGVKSCGCKTSEMHSISCGGTGVPYEHSSLQNTIRTSPQNKEMIAEALRLAEYKCAISGINTNRLQVHHIVSLSSLLKTYFINKDNWTEFSWLLFDLDNLIVLEKSIHQKLHKRYGFETNEEQLREFMESFIIKL